MLAHFRIFSSLRPWSTVVHSRRLLSAAAKQPITTDEDLDERDARPNESLEVGFDTSEEGYHAWLSGEGRQFKEPHRPKNWLGGNVTPFPLNASFKPPTPVSDQLRTVIYRQFMADPAVNNVRSLAALYGLSLKRVDAILRLKGLEEHWMKGKQVQTGFQKGMERILGVDEKHVATKGTEALGEDTAAADLQSDETGNDLARTRYQRLFWEPVVEGQEPIVPEILKDSAKTTRTPKASSPSDIHLVQLEGRPNIRFIDVKDKFVDKKDVLHRQKEAERRSKVRARRAARKHQLIASAKAAAL